MYNEDQKKRYIAYKESTTVIPDDYLVRQFNKVESREEELRKDLCNFNKYEILDYYKSLNITSLESIKVLNSHFSLYTQFCLGEHLVSDNQNHFFLLDNEVLIDCVNKIASKKKIITREELLKWVNDLPNPRDAFILLSLFEFGKSKDFLDIVYAKYTDINSGQISLHSGRTAKVSEKLVSVAEKANENNIFYFYFSTQMESKELIPSKYIVRHLPNARIDANDFQQGRRIYKYVTNAINYLGGSKFINPNAIVESGKLHMIRTQAQKYNMTPVDYIKSDYIKEVEEQYNCKIYGSTYILKYSEYLE